METESKKTGRPSDYTQDLADKICAELAEGKSLRTVCVQEGMPDKATVFRWLRQNKAFCDQYAKAKEESADALSEEVLDFADMSIEDIVGNDKSDGARVQARKLQVDARKWLMSKMKPKKYGDKLDLTSAGEKLPQPIFGGASVQSNHSN